jgi:hypothetical protein
VRCSAASSRLASSLLPRIGHHRPRSSVLASSGSAVVAKVRSYRGERRSHEVQASENLCAVLPGAVAAPGGPWSGSPCVYCLLLYTWRRARHDRPHCPFAPCPLDQQDRQPDGSRRYVQ